MKAPVVVAGRYMRVGEKKGPLVIGGAEKKMEEDSTFMYVPRFRVAGPEADIKAFLKEKQKTEDLDDKDVRDALKGAYTKSSLEKKSIREAFEQEIEQANEARAASTSTKAEMREVNLMVLVGLVKQYKEQKKNDPSSVRVVTKANVDIKSKLASLDGKVLDVTNMKRKGTDTKKVAFKDGGKKKRLSQQEGDTLYNVVYDSSNRSASAGVKNFLITHGSFDSTTIDKIVAAIKGGETVNVSRAKSPRRSPLVSPRRRKKQQSSDVDDILGDLE